MSVVVFIINAYYYKLLYSLQLTSWKLVTFTTGIVL